MTSPQEQRAEFLARRRQGIGGSDAAAVLGVDPYKNALDVYREKVGEVPDLPASPAIQRGRILEPTVAELYTEQTGRKIRKQAQRAHAEYPWVIGNIDYQILANGDDRGTGLLEIKCPGIRNFLKVQRNGLPAHWIVQGQHYLSVYGYEWMSYAIFNADLWKLLHFDITRDDDFIHRMLAAESRFWQENVVKRVPPTVGLVTALPEMPEVSGAIMEREDPEWAEAVESFQQARTLKETAEAVETQAKDRLKELMGEKGVAEGAGLRVYWRTMPGKRTFDRKALEGAKPLDRLKVLAVFEDLKLVMTPESWERFIGRLNVSLGDATLDLAQFDKTGKPFDELRTFFLKPEVGEDE